ncbi:right-handed parallel beta-helix repeat-containing protein [Bacillus sp. BRMEA1]|uniref:right-handed parallel beta-helix repeat-containing protein n=1 Tax=Neobacillus endophyticus TaxID=2738405 RepID=UPI001563B405|nr:right-handed parallel beta-helix repeat-containing protein [Neobacillus endophyticus]NRD79073.1 right-handed parallel beta-helix repeat-containing protein [Neobacillus endophyticus]
MGKKIFVKCGQSINAAIAVANPGDAIIVEECVYHEAVVVDKNDIRLVSEEPHEAVLDGKGLPPGSNGITIIAPGVEVNGFKIRNYTGDGIFVGDAARSVKLIDNKIHDIIRNGIEINNLFGEVLVWKNSVEDIGGNGIFSNLSANSYIQNKIEDVGGFGIFGRCCNTAHQNEIVNSGSMGINFINCCNFVTENKVVNSGDTGISAGVGGSNGVLRNLVENSASFGIILGPGEDSLAYGNHVKNSVNIGIKSATGEDLIMGNTVSDSGSNGIDGGLFGFEIILKNLVKKSRGTGINVYGRFNITEKNTVVNNKNGIVTNTGNNAQVDNFMLQNEVEYSVEDGIRINATNNRSHVAENDVENSGNNGVDVFSGFNNIENNEIEKNRVGINIEPTATDNFVARNELENNGKNIINNGADTIFFKNKIDKEDK